MFRKHFPHQHCLVRHLFTTAKETLCIAEDAGHNWVSQLLLISQGCASEHSLFLCRWLLHSNPWKGRHTFSLRSLSSSNDLPIEKSLISIHPHPGFPGRECAKNLLMYQHLNCIGPTYLIFGAKILKYVHKSAIFSSLFLSPWLLLTHCMIWAVICLIVSLAWPSANCYHSCTDTLSGVWWKLLCDWRLPGERNSHLWLH